MRVAIQSIHRYPTPTLRLISAPRRSGMGQGPGGAATCAQYIANAFAGLPSAAEAAMLLNTGSPSGAVLSALYITGGSPAEAAQNIVTQLAQEYCGAVQAEISSGDPNAASPPDCGDGGASCAAAAYPRWLAYYSSLPASVWSTGMVSRRLPIPRRFQRLFRLWLPRRPPRPIRHFSLSMGHLRQGHRRLNRSSKILRLRLRHLHLRHLDQAQAHQQPEPAAAQAAALQPLGELVHRDFLRWNSKLGASCRRSGACAACHDHDGRPPVRIGIGQITSGPITLVNCKVISICKPRL